MPPSRLYTVQMVKDATANKQTLALIDARRATAILRRSEVLDYVNVTVGLPADAVAQVADRPDVVSVNTYVEPKLNCERQAVTLTGNISANKPGSPGHLSWLALQGFTQAQFDASGFAVAVVDSGIDSGTTAPGHAGLFVSGSKSNASRATYSKNWTTDSAGNDLDGHGTLNAHIIGGFNNLTGFPHEDSAGYNYGLGVAPFVRLHNHKIFSIAGNYEVSGTNATLVSNQYVNGARISSNSWGADNAGGYDADAQEYDTLTRQARPGVAGTQMVFVFAAGNAGSAAQTVGSPGTAKNVITVGASTNAQPFGGADASGIGDSESSLTNAIASFSSRGPCADGRKKPEIVAPGTHVSGGASQATGFNGSGVSGGTNGNHYWPTGQTLYTASSGTSHSTPGVAGAAALIRQKFINAGLTPPSPAMTKAVLMATARYLNGTGAGGNLWSNSQGMGLVDLGRAFDGTTNLVRDEVSADRFTASGQTRTFTANVADTAKPVRITLAWTDAPGSTTGNAIKNVLKLTVTAGGNTYLGNVFSGQFSTTGGTADTKNNAQSVFLPAGTSGSITITVTAANINSQSDPAVAGNNQDFALYAYNFGAAAPPPAGAAAIAVSAGNNQTATAGAAFATALQAKVTNSTGGAVSGATVTFTLPSTGVSGTFPGGVRTATATTNASGIATAPAITAGTATGTFTATATVAGVATPANFSLTVSAPAPTQLLGNPGFETGTAAPWSVSTGALDNSTGYPARTGSWKVWMCGYGSAHTDTLSQTVTIPSTATTATLSFYLRVDTAETTTTTAYDKLTVQVRNSSGTVLATLATYSNLNKGTTYSLRSFDLSAYKGQTIQVYLTATEDGSQHTSFLVDDFSLTAQ